MASLRRLIGAATVADVIRPSVHTVRTSTSLADVATLFANDTTAAVVVIDHRGAVRGLVERADLTLWTPGRKRWLVHARAQPLAKLCAADLMKPVGGTVSRGTPLGQAMAIMGFAGMRVLPVTCGPSGGRLVGLISTADIKRWLASVHRASLKQESAR